MSSKTSHDGKPARALWLWVAVGAAALLLAALLYSGTVKEYVDAATDWAKDTMNAHPLAGGLIFFAFAALSAMLAFASAVVLVPPANLVWGQPITFLLLWGGWLAGAAAAYGIGRLARPLLVRVGYGAKLQKYEKFVGRRMNFWTVLMLCIAVPSEVPGYLCGGAHYSFLKFIAAMAIAEAIYALGATIAGETLLDAEPLPLLAAIGILIVIAALAGALLRSLKKRKSRRAT
jgi:uncharacterized membrane protein YdjX (TVP38/TMEM64 family)